MLDTCFKCEKAVKQTYVAAVAVKLKVKLCSDCINIWFDIRDRVVEEAFREYTSVKPKK